MCRPFFFFFSSSLLTHSHPYFCPPFEECSNHIIVFAQGLAWFVGMLSRALAHSFFSYSLSYSLTASKIQQTPSFLLQPPKGVIIHSSCFFAVCAMVPLADCCFLYTMPMTAGRVDVGSQRARSVLLCCANKQCWQPLPPRPKRYEIFAQQSNKGKKK